MPRAHKCVLLIFHTEKKSEQNCLEMKKEENKDYRKRTGFIVCNLCFEFNICTLFRRCRRMTGGAEEWTMHLNCNVCGGWAKKKVLPINAIAIKKQTTCLHPLQLKRFSIQHSRHSTITRAQAVFPIQTQSLLNFLLLLLFGYSFCLHLHHVIISLFKFVVTTNTNFNTLYTSCSD